MHFYAVKIHTVIPFELKINRTFIFPDELQPGVL